jgi:hypothetical protein
MVEAKFMLEINTTSLTIDIKGDEAALISLLIVACENNSDVERLLESTLDTLGKIRVHEATGDLPKV